MVRLIRLLGWFVGILVLATLIPVGDALWSEVLGASGSVHIAEWTPTPPAPGGDGCTPGFWKQEQHFSSWPEPYLPEADLAQAFGVNPLEGDPTLLDGLEAKGGGLNALLRHAVAALLNAASADVDFALDIDTVLEIFQTALQSGEYEATKDALEAANESDCPLPIQEEGTTELSAAEFAAATTTTESPSAGLPAAQESATATVEPPSAMPATETSNPRVEPSADPEPRDEPTTATES